MPAEVSALQKEFPVVCATKSHPVAAITPETVSPKNWTTGTAVPQPAVAQAKETSRLPLKFSAQSDPPCPRAFYSPWFTQWLASLSYLFCSSMPLHKDWAASRALSARPFQKASAPLPDGCLALAARIAHHLVDWQNNSVCKRCE